MGTLSILELLMKLWDFIKANYKTLIVVTLAVLVVFLFLRLQNEKEQVAHYKSIYKLNDSALQDKIKTVRNDLGQEISFYRTRYADAAALANSSSDWANSLKQELEDAKIKLKNVKSYIGVKTTVADSLRITLVDTIHYFDTGALFKHFAWSDDYLKVDGTIYLRAFPDKIVLDQVGLKYRLDDTKEITHYFDRGFLRKPRINVMVKQHNPNATTQYVQTYTIKYNEPFIQRWYVDLVIGGVVGYMASKQLSK